MPFVAAALALLLAQSLPPAPLNHVTDAANVLDDERERALEEKLAQYERETRRQILVYVDRTVPEGVTLESLAADAMRTWPRQDDCAILFVYVDSRETRLQTSDSVRRVIPDARAKQIIVDMRPLLRAGDFTGAVEHGASVIAGMLTRGVPAVQPAPQPVVHITHTEPPRRVWPKVGKVLSIFGIAAVLIVIVVAAAAGQAGQRRSRPHHVQQQEQWRATHNSLLFQPPVDPTPPPPPDPPSNNSNSSSGGGGASDKW